MKLVLPAQGRSPAVPSGLHLPGTGLWPKRVLSGLPRDQGQPTNLTTPGGHQEKTQLVLMNHLVTPQIHFTAVHRD